MVNTNFLTAQLRSAEGLLSRNGGVGLSDNSAFVNYKPTAVTKDILASLNAGALTGAVKAAQHGFEADLWWPHARPGTALVPYSAPRSAIMLHPSVQNKSIVPLAASSIAAQSDDYDEFLAAIRRWFDRASHRRNRTLRHTGQQSPWLLQSSPFDNIDPRVASVGGIGGSPRITIGSARGARTAGHGAGVAGSASRSAEAAKGRLAFLKQWFDQYGRRQPQQSSKAFFSPNDPSIKINPTISSRATVKPAASGSAVAAGSLLSGLKRRAGKAAFKYGLPIAAMTAIFDAIFSAAGKKPIPWSRGTIDHMLRLTSGDIPRVLSKNVSNYDPVQFEQWLKDPNRNVFGYHSPHWQEYIAAGLTPSEVKRRYDAHTASKHNWQDPSYSEQVGGTFKTLLTYPRRKLHEFASRVLHGAYDKNAPWYSRIIGSGPSPVELGRTPSWYDVFKRFPKEEEHVQRILTPGEAYRKAWHARFPGAQVKSSAISEIIKQAAGAGVTGAKASSWKRKGLMLAAIPALAYAAHKYLSGNDADEPGLTQWQPYEPPQVTPPSAIPDIPGIAERMQNYPVDIPRRFGYYDANGVLHFSGGRTPAGTPFTQHTPAEQAYIQQIWAARDRNVANAKARGLQAMERFGPYRDIITSATKEQLPGLVSRIAAAEGFSQHATQDWVNRLRSGFMPNYGISNDDLRAELARFKTPEVNVEPSGVMPTAAPPSVVSTPAVPLPTPPPAPLPAPSSVTPSVNHNSRYEQARNRFREVGIPH